MSIEVQGELQRCADLFQDRRGDGTDEAPEAGLRNGDHVMQVDRRGAVEAAIGADDHLGGHAANRARERRDR